MVLSSSVSLRRNEGREIRKARRQKIEVRSQRTRVIKVREANRVKEAIRVIKVRKARSHR